MKKKPSNKIKITEIIKRLNLRLRIDSVKKEIRKILGVKPTKFNKKILEKKYLPKKLKYFVLQKV